MAQLILPSDSNIYQAFERLIDTQRLVFFAGLPGVGKSLLLHQLAIMADQAGRKVHLLQWDVARQPFVADEYVLASYPERNGITHGVVRKAVGLWARAAIGRWHQEHPVAADLLIGEFPLIGNRLTELAQRLDDDVELLLGGPATRFVIPIPSHDLRRMIEARREASSASPQHERERADAIPQVLRAAWLELCQVAQELGLVGAAAASQPAYDPELYYGVYSTVLKHRNCQRQPMTIHLPTEHLSVYDLQVQQGELAARADEVRRYIADVERRYPDPASLEHDIGRWYLV